MDDGSFDEWMSLAMVEYDGDMEMKEDEEGLNTGFELYGDVFIGEKKEVGSLRLISQNQDKFGSMAASHRLEKSNVMGDAIGDSKHGKTNEQLWTSWSVREADVMLLQDTAWEDAHDVSYPALQTAGKVAIEMKKLWGGLHARLVTAQGYKARSGGWKGGTAVATHSALKPFAGKKIGDCRALGRYAITNLVGANGCTVMIISWYIPTRSVRGAWKHQSDWMELEKVRLQKKRAMSQVAVGDTGHNRMAVGESGQVRQVVGNRGQVMSALELRTLAVLEQEDVDPKALLLSDIEYEIERSGAEYLIIGGDANTTPPDLAMARSCKEVRADHVKDTERMALFCESQGLVEPYRALGHDRVPKTWRGRGELADNWSWIDYWLVAKKMVDRGLVRKCGVVRDFAESTDHAALYLDLDWENLIGKSELWKDIAALQGKQKEMNQLAFGVVKLKDDARISCMHEMLVLKDDKCRHEEAERLLRLAESGGFEEDDWISAESCMGWLEQTMVSAQTAVYKAMIPKVGGGRASRKHHYSKEFVRVKEKYRVLSKMVNRWDAKKRSLRCMMKLASRAKLVLGDELPVLKGHRCIPNQNSKFKDWECWISGARVLQAGFKASIHGSRRRRMREKHVARHKKLTDLVDKNQLGKAMDNVRKKQRDGAVDTAIIRGEDGRLRAARGADEVIQHHYDVAVKWMGDEHRRWYYTAEGCVHELVKGDAADGEPAVVREDVHDCGKERQVLWRGDDSGDYAREELAKGSYMGDDVLKAALPEVFHDLAQDLQRVEIMTEEGRRPISETDYEGSGLGEKIGYDDWRQFWRRVKGGTRGGASGLHVDLIKACYRETVNDEGKKEMSSVSHFADTALKLVNVAIIMRRDYKSWLQEQLYYFIKNPGTVGLENSRPVGLLEILFKCREAFDSAALMQVWRKTGVLQPEQWAYQEGRGCEGPLLMWMLLSEEAALNREDIGEAETDSERAFDAPSPEAIAISQKRLAVPQWKVDADMRRKKKTRTRVITPFGLTKSFHRVQGIAQGGAGSPAEWLMLIDSLAAYVKRVANAQPGVLVTERGDVLEVLLNLLADDQGYAASGKNVEGALEQRVKAATTWCTFFGVNTKLAKSWVALGIWGDANSAEGSRMLHEWEHDKKVELVDEFRGESTALKTKGPFTVSRILGQQRSLAQYAEPAVDHAKAELRVTAAAVRQMPAHKGLATQVAQAVGWRRLAYRLRFAYVFEEQMKDVVMPLKTALVSKLGLAPGTPLGVLNSALWMSAADAMLVERVALFVKLLNTEDMRGWALRGAVQRQQQYEGCNQPVLEAGNSKCRCVKLSAADEDCKGMRRGCSTMMHWSGTWVGMISRGMEDVGMTVTGGLGMPLLREGDRCLVDEACWEDREMVRMGCMATEMWRCSEVMNLEGTDICRALCSNGPAEKAAGRRWCNWVRAKVTGMVGEGGLQRSFGGWATQLELGAWHSEAIWSWQLVSWIGCNGETLVGRPVGQQGNQVKVLLLEGLTMAEYCVRQDTEVKAGAGFAGTTLTRRWHDRWGSVDNKCWLWGGTSSKSVGVVWMESEDLYPVSAERWEAKEHWGVKVIYRISELCEELHSEQQLVRRGQNWLHEGAVWSREHVEEIVTVACGERTNWDKLLNIDELSGRVLVVFTDGGLDHGGTMSAAGQYAAVIAERVLGSAWMSLGKSERSKLKVLAKQGGVCQGPREWMSSHRSELMAVILGVSMLYVWAEWKGAAEVWLDNESVVKGCQQLVGAEVAEDLFHSGRSLRQEMVNGYSNRETWMWGRDDRDLWEVLEGLLRWVKPAGLSFHWVKSHMDEVEGHVLSWQERGNVLSDAECNKMKGRMAGTEEQLLPRARSWRLKIAGVEVVAPLRKAMEEELRAQRLLKYLRDDRGWGSSAERWLDSINKKMWMLGGMSVSQKVAMIKYVFAMIGTDDVVAGNWLRKQDGEVKEVKKTDEYKQMMQCALCLQEIVPAGRYSKNWHLVAECKCAEVVKLRKKLQAEVSLSFEYSSGLRDKLDCLCAPWMLHEDGTVLDLGSAEELAAVLDTGDSDVALMMKELKSVAGIGTLEWEDKRKLLFKGQMGAEWQKFLEGCGAKPEEAAVIRKKVFDCAVRYGSSLQAVYWDLKSRPSSDYSVGDVAARQAAQDLVTIELGRIKDAGQLGYQKKRVAGLGWKSKVEWALKRKQRRQRQIGAEKRSSVRERKLAAKVAAHLTQAELRKQSRSVMSNWFKRSRERAEVLAHELQDRKDLELTAELSVGDRGHGVDGGSEERGMVQTVGSEVETAVERDGSEVGLKRQGGSAEADDGAGSRSAQRKRRRRGISSYPQEAAGECRQGSERLAVVDSGGDAARGCGKRDRAEAEQGTDIDTGAAAELALGSGSGLEVMGGDEAEGSGDSSKDSGRCREGSGAAAESSGSQAVRTAAEKSCAERRSKRGAAVGDVGGVRGASGGTTRATKWLCVADISKGIAGYSRRIGSGRAAAVRDSGGCAGLDSCEGPGDESKDSTVLVCRLGSKSKESGGGVRVGSGGDRLQTTGAQAQARCANGSVKDSTAILGAGGSKEDWQGRRGHGSTLGGSTLHNSSQERCEQQGEEGSSDGQNEECVQQLQANEGSIQETAALSGDAERRRVQGVGQIVAGITVGNGGQWAVRGAGAARWANAEDKTIEEEITLAGEGGLLPSVECLGEKAGYEVAEDDLSLGDESRWEEDAAGGQHEVWGEVQVQGRQQHKTCGTGGGYDSGDEEDRDEEGAVEVCVSSGAAAEGAGVSDGGVGMGAGGGMADEGGEARQFVMGEGECYCWCGRRMWLMAAASARGAGICDVGGCGGRVELDDRVYACTEHKDYACRECVPRTARLTVDALLEECVVVEQELEQFRQDLGLDATVTGRQEDGEVAAECGEQVIRVDEPQLGMGVMMRRVMTDEQTAIGRVPEEAGYAVLDKEVGSSDEAPQALHHALAQTGVEAACWIGGRRMKLRKETEVPAREDRKERKDSQRLRRHKRGGEWEDNLLRARADEMVLEAAEVAGLVGCHGDPDDRETVVKKTEGTVRSTKRPVRNTDAMDHVVMNTSMSQYMAVGSWLQRNSDRLRTNIGDYGIVAEMIRVALMQDNALWYRTMHQSVQLEEVLEVATLWLNGTGTVGVLRSDSGRWAAVERTADAVERLFRREQTQSWAEHSCDQFKLLLEQLLQRIANRIAVIEDITPWDPLEVQGELGSGSGAGSDDQEADGGTGAAPQALSKRKADAMEFLASGGVTGGLLTMPQARLRRKAGDNTMMERLEDDEGIG